MGQQTVISLDVGGSHIRSGVVRDRKIVGIPVESESFSEGDQATILALLTRLITDTNDSAQRSATEVIVAIPNPFDYQLGISFLEHKFSSLYQINLKEVLEHNLDLPVTFLNDAAAFALGEFIMKFPNEERLLGVTLGSGVGSGFIEQGQIVNTGMPGDGYIWNLNYKEGIFEDYIAKNKIESSYFELTNQSHNPKEIEIKARHGDKNALQVYKNLGQDLGQGLAQICGGFHPTKIVIGGKISRAFDLFSDQAEWTYKECADYFVSFTQENDADLTLIGAAEYASQ